MLISSVEGVCWLLLRARRRGITPTNAAAIACFSPPSLPSRRPIHASPCCNTNKKNNVPCNTKKTTMRNTSDYAMYNTKKDYTEKKTMRRTKKRLHRNRDNAPYNTIKDYVPYNTKKDYIVQHKNMVHHRYSVTTI
jgi:hypothetical protein